MLDQREDGLVRDNAASAACRWPALGPNGKRAPNSVLPDAAERIRSRDPSFARGPRGPCAPSSSAAIRDRMVVRRRLRPRAPRSAASEATRLASDASITPSSSIFQRIRRERRAGRRDVDDDLGRAGSRRAFGRAEAFDDAVIGEAVAARRSGGSGSHIWWQPAVCLPWRAAHGWRRRRRDRPWYARRSRPAARRRRHWHGRSRAGSASRRPHRHPRAARGPDPRR